MQPHKKTERNNQILRWYWDEDVSTYKISQRLGDITPIRVLEIIKKYSREYLQNQKNNYEHA